MTEAGDPFPALKVAQDGAQPKALTGGMSPYATGGGGVTFERKVAVTYLAHLLSGDGAVELGGERRVVSVRFQQAPDHPVDDLVVTAGRADEAEPSLVLALGMRRAPDLIMSDESAQKLIRDFVRALLNVPSERPEHRFALVVAGQQDQAGQLASLAALAAVQMDATSFFNLIRTPKKFTTDIRGRLDHIEGLVRKALTDLAVVDPDILLVQQRTWELLSHLTVLMPRLETPDETDWATVVNSLIPVAHGADLSGAGRLRDRLVVLADEYAPKAATVDLTVLRRAAHNAIEATTRRNEKGWQALAHLNDRALSSVRRDIRSADGARQVHIDRRDIADLIIASAATGTAVLAYGESGVGKSALVLHAATFAATADPDAVQVLLANLRHLPRTTLEFESLLGCPLGTLLAEFSAPHRLLVIDGSDAVAEGMLEQLRYLADAARSAGVALIAITAADNKQVVRDTVAELFGDVVEHVVPGLTDLQVDEVVAAFGQLANLAENPRSRELLRRPVVMDLLVRGGISGLPLSDADAMQQIWLGLVRRREQADRGVPDARDVAMLKLAGLALSGGDTLDAVAGIDPTALEGLRRDGLLRTPVDYPFKIGPEFAHDEVRRYAVARLLLADGDPTTRLLEAGVPRWALGATRLACQALLAAPDTSANPVRGRFARLQAAFSGMVDAGHGERWGDVPSEALLTLGDPGPVLRDAWADVRGGKGTGLQRLGRLVDQRLRDDSGAVRIVAVEPVVDLLLDDAEPWHAGEHVQDILRDWLRAHILASTLEGHQLRVRLRGRLVAACAAGQRRLEEERAAAAAARAARSPEEIKEERRFTERHRALFTEIGYPRSGGRRRRAELPAEITDAVVVELLALLGPDLGEDGEAILRRVGQDAPSWLAPAVEEFLTGRALATYRRGFLAELTEAYYIDNEEDGSGLHEDGIRDHQNRSFGITPLGAWYRGPFMALFQSDFHNGVAALNRMLNHAAQARARTLAGLDRGYDDGDLEKYQTELDITGERRVYTGDGHVWIWYRGTGVGPNPCVSALQALERVCDQLIDLGLPLDTITATLLHGCENLAMVGLVVGVLVRHLEHADRPLDLYLAEPIIWHLEFDRTVSESSGFAANSDDLVGGERRTWSMREVAMTLVVRADEARAAELRAIGEQLVKNARRLIRAGGDGAEGGAQEHDDAALEEELAPVRGWASGLDRGTYQAEQTDAGLFIQSTPPEEVLQVLQRSNDDLHRAQEAMRLIVRYYIGPKKGAPEDVPADELAADVSSARDLLDNPPGLSVGERWDTPTAVAAAALSAHLLRGITLPDDLVVFAVDTVLRIAGGEASPRQFEYEDTFFEQSADRSAARALPLLLLPSATALLALVDGVTGTSTDARVRAGGLSLARGVAREVRLHLARRLDRLWQVPCGEGACCHQVALQLAVESMRDCAFGEWDANTGRRRTLLLEDPAAVSLAALADDAIYFSRLDAAIRALAPAAVANICVSSDARAVLDVALAAQRRSLLSYEHDMDHRGTHALVSARALLTLAGTGDHAPLFDHIDALADSATLLGTFLRALSSAGEEAAERAATVRRVWPEVATRVLDWNESGRTPFSGRHHGDMTLAALLPNAAGEVSFLYRELESEPIIWWEPLAWKDLVERWLPVAAGNATCVDHLISFLGALPMEERVRHGLPWVAALVLEDPRRVAGRSFLLPTWLIESRSAADQAELLPEWQRVVDALVVAGVSRLAPYSD